MPQELFIKKSIFIFIVFIFQLTPLSAEYTPFIKSQLALIHQMNDNNVTQSEIKELAHQQERIYVSGLETVLLNKVAFSKEIKPYQKEIFILKKLVKRNASRSHKYAVIRDEALIKSYQVLQAQDKMIKNLLYALDNYSFGEYETKMNEEFVDNQLRIEKIDTVDYHDVSKLKGTSKVLLDAQKNIDDYYALIEINNDLLGFCAMSIKRMYRLNKYSKYKILAIALYLDHTKYGEKINKALYPYNLSIVKLPLMLLLSFFIYAIRRPLYKRVEALLHRTEHLEKYSKEIMRNTYQLINAMFMVINLNLLIYIYHDFYTGEGLVRLFDMIYALFFTAIVYRILNTIAGIRIHDMNHSNNSIKGEMVNVGIKIINFLILIMGVLLVLHLAGADLATVLSGLGIGGFAIALAARESLSNFLGTISILMSDTFSQGDWIAIDGKEGTVVEIGLRVTTLRTFDNSLISIPNGTLANHDVQNWNKRTIGRRIKMSLGVKYDSRPEDLRQAISEIREMLLHHPEIATNNTGYDKRKTKKTTFVSQEDALGVKRTLLVYLDELSDSSINILVYCFAKKTDWNLWLETKEDIIYRIMDILDKNNLEFAYPSMSLYHEKRELSEMETIKL